MAKLGRPKAAVVITDVERTELVRLTKRANVNRLLAFRARLVLACADAAADTAVARRHRTTNSTVGKWRKRFIARRLEGLLDEPRVGGSRTISDADVEAVVVKTLETTPKGETHWSTRTMAAKAGMSHTVMAASGGRLGSSLTSRSRSSCRPTPNSSTRFGISSACI